MEGIAAQSVSMTGTPLAASAGRGRVATTAKQLRGIHRPHNLNTLSREKAHCVELLSNTDVSRRIDFYCDAFDVSVRADSRGHTASQARSQAGTEAGSTSATPDAPRPHRHADGLLHAKMTKLI